MLCVGIHQEAGNGVRREWAVITTIAGLMENRLRRGGKGWAGHNRGDDGVGLKHRLGCQSGAGTEFVGATQ
ncbi:hypothetical protein ACIBG0_33150 [Nocardia sp. NPDC050630]|uniref:hypothetical protein n=1 Tax=Nocardia sp. NPDC050630 TaxID=3364321 RepID=UPI0037A2B77E